MRAQFAVLAAAVDLLVVIATVASTGYAYHRGWLGVSDALPALLESGTLLSLLFVILNGLRSEYELINYLSFGGHGRRVLLVWNTTFLISIVAIFAIKESGHVSRVCTVLAYLVGYGTLMIARGLVVLQVRRRARAGSLSVLRVLLVGDEEELRTFATTHKPWSVGLDVIASAVLRGPGTLKEDLALAAASARVLRPDDIFILTPWTNNAVIEAALSAFMNVPAAIHLGPQSVLDRFSKAAVHRIGSISSLHLVRHPLNVTERASKRAFDLVAASLLLIVLLPVFAVLAVLIKLDSRGPVFFSQRRYGFNQETFRVFKFRSMSVAEDGRGVVAATRGDARVTRVGRALRRLSLDELPQLLNVLRGEMSLVGPRPHALVHNQHFERNIAVYARRHNVKPGITGWAQIHGLRGEIVTEEFMRTRVEYDIFYIDNWTFGLDLRILARTILSPETRANAY